MESKSGEERRKRLIWARENAGFKKRRPASRELRVNSVTYDKHENGERTFDYDDCLKYARKFKVSVTWLAFGMGKPTDAEEEPPFFPWEQWRGLDATDRQQVVDLIEILTKRSASRSQPVGKPDFHGFFTGEPSDGDPGLRGGERAIARGSRRKPKGS